MQSIKDSKDLPFIPMKAAQWGFEVIKDRLPGYEDTWIADLASLVPS